MKKILTTIFLGVFLVGLLGPVLASAQPAKPADCCILKHNIKLSDGHVGLLGVDVCIKSAVAGKDLTGDTTVVPYTHRCTKDIPCLFEKDCAIAERGVSTDLCGGKGLGGIANNWGIVCIVNTIYNVTDWIFYLMLVATVILVTIGGAMYMMAAGDPEKAGKGKSLIIYGIIGLAIAVFAKAVPSIVKLILAI